MMNNFSFDINMVRWEMIDESASVKLVATSNNGVYISFQLIFHLVIRMKARLLNV